MSQLATALCDTPVGTLKLFSNGQALTQILLPSQLTSADRSEDNPDEFLHEACQTFQAWFAGDQPDLSVPCEFTTGTPFQREVWKELCRIPIGTTISYAELAIRVGRPAAVRAVGTANGRNPLPVIVPCHRVIGSDGSLTGYAGGTTMKQQLLDHERSLCESPCAG